MKLAPVIRVDGKKCVNCHACISVCPVKLSNDASGDHVTVISDLCIGCGECMRACNHEARLPVDDFEQFVEALMTQTPMVAVVAPAVAANFPGHYEEFNGWLKSVGIEAIFDVSFGAELTVKSYIHHLKTARPEIIVAQPCPAIVSYIQIYQPELLKHLAPVDSPMLHTIKMIREYHTEYADHKIVVISPCTAKKREFEETGYGDYNVTLQALDRYFKENKVDLSLFPKTGFNSPDPERAVLFSTPGGLAETAERWFGGIGKWTRKIEGPTIVYDYLKKLPDAIKGNYAPKLLDCLNCQHGCNGGTGTINRDAFQDQLEHYIEERRIKMQSAYEAKAIQNSTKSKEEIEQVIELFWGEDLYKRTYENYGDLLSSKMPTDSELKKIYLRMDKERKEDYLDCTACGYNSCRLMAVAIHNGLNKPENCYLYREKAMKKMEALLKKLLDSF